MTQFTPYGLRRRPDQTIYRLNEILDTLNKMKDSIRVVSADGKQCIICGNMPKNAESIPTNPATGKPYSFGVAAFDIQGDRIILKEGIIWLS